MNLTIGFLSNKLTLRGTEIAMYDYADYNETMFNNKSIIITRNIDKYRHEFDISDKAYDKFKKRFTVEYYDTNQDIDRIVEKYNISHLYIIKAGTNNGLYSSKCKNLIHCVFNSSEPHGQVYSAISDDVNNKFKTNLPVVPHMVRVYDTEQNLRQELGIPDNAIVYGRYGGVETFDLGFVHESIKKIVNEKENVYFIFMNTNRFYNHARIIYLNGTEDMEYKRKFINTSNALLHARKDGETFGLACGEFAICNKPVITWGLSECRNHLDILKDKCLIYKNHEDIYNILKNDKAINFDVTDNGYHYYNPTNIMEIFKKIYLD